MPSVITLQSSSYAVRVTLLPSLQQVPFPAALPSALSPGERRYPRQRSGQAREPLRLLPAGRGRAGRGGAAGSPRRHGERCGPSAPPLSVPGRGCACCRSLPVKSRLPPPRNPAPPPWSPGSSPASWCECRGGGMRRALSGLGRSGEPLRGAAAAPGGAAGFGRGARRGAAGRALPRGRPRPRPGGSALAVAAREQRLGRGRGSGSRPGRRQSACGALRGREALRVLRFLQADLRHPLPCVFLLQGREDEKREGICEYGFAVWARWSPRPSRLPASPRPGPGPGPGPVSGAARPAAASGRTGRLKSSPDRLRRCFEEGHLLKWEVLSHKRGFSVFCFFLPPPGNIG